MMSSDRLIELLVEWEEGCRQGRAPTAEDLCPDDPTLQKALRQRIRQRERFRRLWTLQGQTTPAPAPALPAGPPQVEGFEILGTLGAGGMGVVYRARQASLDRLVALKVIRAGAYANREELSRFRREAEAIARLQHPNIVQVYEVGEHQGLPCLALEYVGGGSLAERLRGAPLPPRQAAELALVLARAVQHAHERGVLHRDLKPANVLLTPDGTPKLTDFGLAKRLDVDAGETRTGAVLGTPSYMAPEQAAGKTHEVGPAADVYALGAILYECLTGRPPFQGATMLETLEQVRAHDPVSPAALRPGVPRDLEVICLKCLEKEPRHRYPSAAALANDVQRFLDGEPISARSLTLLDRLARALSYSGSPAAEGLRSWSRLLLWAAPLPVLLQLVLFLLFADWPSYPVICISTGIVAVVIVYPLILWPMREPLRKVPRGYRRLVWSMMCTRGIGFLLIPILVALMRPGHDPAEFFLVFPLWIFLDGNYYFLAGSEAGISYPVALVFYAAAVLASLAPPLSPLAVGAAVSVSMLIDGLYLRLWKA
jgi:serine/threonine-protein kinase